MIRLILSILIGGAIGTIISLGTWSKKLDESNNLGDTTGGFDDYGTKIDFIMIRDDVDKNDRAPFIKAYGKNSLKDRGIITDDDLKTSNAGYDVIPDDMELPPVDKPLFKPL